MISDAPGSQPLKSISQSGRTYVRFLNNHRFAIEAAYDYVTADQGLDLQAFVDSQQGGDKFQFVAAYKVPRGVATGTPLVNGAGQSGLSVITDGWTPSITNIMRANDIVKFGNSSKVYSLAANASSNVSGQATLILTYPLRVPTTDNDVITVRDVPFTVSFLQTPQFPVFAPHWYSVEISMVEEL